ncbi:MAG TPA: glycosyltransferase family 4 protein [Candidatus Saccharimonadales bacterium]|nr:glycosyltransferase family 4 protein [Candidatus Saccharimonadales bacterium]
MEKLKIGLVLDDSLDKTDGVQQYVLTLGHWLEQTGHQVHYLVGETRRKDIPRLHSLSRNRQVHFNQNRMSIPMPANASRIQTLLEKEKFDVLHVQMPYSPWLAGRIVRAAPPTTVIIGTFHIIPYSGLEAVATRLLAAYLWRSRRRFDHVFSVSPAAAKFARKAFRVSSQVLPNAVALSRFHSASSYARYNDGKLNIVFLGRLVPRKGCKQLLEAIQILHSEGRLDNVRVIICGKGPMRGQLEEYVHDNHLAHHVSFIGFVTEADKPKYLASADIAIFPSTGGESFGIVLIEAMAAARGVVLGGDNVGYRSVLGDRPKQLFETADIKALAKSLRHFLRHTRLRQAAYVWQQEAVVQYDIRVIGDTLVKIYLHTLQTKRQMR